METGWKEDLDFLGPYGLERMSRLPVVRQSAKLTENGELPPPHIHALKISDVVRRVGEGASGTSYIPQRDPRQTTQEGARRGHPGAVR